MVYLLHFDSPFKHAGHYIGFTESPDGLEARMDKHRKGHGSKLMKAVSEAGIAFKVVRLWEYGSRDFERLLKNRKNAKSLCPVCNKNAMKNATYTSIVSPLVISSTACNDSGISNSVESIDAEHLPD